MQMKRQGNKLSLILCIVLITATALFTTACSDNKTSSEASTSEKQATESKVLGEGNTEFFFTVTDSDGNETPFTIHTDKKTVGDALIELKLLEGEDGPYGLYVKTVNGITVDFDKDGKYWAFYVDGEYAQSGVDTTDIKEGAIYSFKVEK